MAAKLKQRRQITAAEQVVARLDSYSQDEHKDNLQAARERVVRNRVRRERAQRAAARLRSA